VPIQIFIGNRPLVDVYLERGSWELYVDGDRWQFYCDTPGARYTLHRKSWPGAVKSAATSEVRSAA
jgi:hypothetical protein